MGFFDFLKPKKKEETDQNAMGFISKDGKKGMSFEEAQDMREHFLSVMSQDDRNKEFNAAAGLMLKKAFDTGIEAYELLAKKYPDSLGLCESQIGAAYFFKEEYEKAIEYYIAAMNHGENKDMMDDNIWEAYEVLFQNTKDKEYLAKYLGLFPQGSYAAKAKKMMG